MNPLDPLLDHCLSAWLSWAEQGAPPTREGFRRHDGLCIAIPHYAKRRLRMNLWESTDLSRYLEKQLRLDLGDYLHPFNVSFREYQRETQKHLNPHRVGWVRQYLGDRYDAQAFYKPDYSFRSDLL